MTQGKMYLKYYARDLPWMGFWIGVFWLFGVAFSALITFLFRDDQSFGCMGGFMALLGLLVAVLAAGNTNSHIRFRLAVAMGSTRQGYLVWNTVLTLAEGLVGAVVVVALARLEVWAFTALLPGWTNDFDFGQFLTPRVLLPLAVGMAAVQLLITALTNRFGMRAFAVVWLAVWLGSMALSSAVNQYQDGEGTLLAGIGAVLLRIGRAVGPTGGIWAGVAALVICAIVGVLMLRKAEIHL